jgi:HTH-type transcriptional repressor of NAD biosynthesis genes
MATENAGMTKRFQRGLVVGKFCPLHLGHESVIRRALEQCEEVVVISYTNPEFPGCEPERRRRWLATRFPQLRSLVLENGPDLLLPPNDAEDLTHRQFTGRVCQEMLGLTVDAVFTSEAYGDGFAATLAEFFRESDPSHPEVAHIQGDISRHQWPVSGTVLRNDVHRHRSFLAPEVYASFVQRVAFLGGESSGKTTLAAALAEQSGTVWVPEYGRELWENRGGVLEPADLREIAQTQIAREEAALLRAHRYVFCDTTPLTTLFYSMEMFGHADPDLAEAAARSYDHLFLCSPDFPFIQDGTRRDAAFRARQHEWYLAELERRGMAWLPVSGSLMERVRSVQQRLLTAR